MLRARDFRRQTFGAIAADGLPHLAQSLAGDVFHFADFMTGARRIAIHQLAGQLGFEDDNGERVSEDVVEIARDALALGELGEVKNLLVGEVEFPAGAYALGGDQIAGADRKGKECADSPGPGRIAEVEALSHHDGRAADEGSDTGKNGLGDKGDESCDIDEDAAEAAVKRVIGNSEQGQSDQAQVLGADGSGKDETRVNRQENDVGDGEFNPCTGAVALDGIEDKENGVDQPDKVIEAAMAMLSSKATSPKRKLRSGRDLGGGGVFAGRVASEERGQGRAIAEGLFTIQFEAQRTQAFASLRVKMIHAAPNINRVNPASASQWINMLPDWA